MLINGIESSLCQTRYVCNVVNYDREVQFKEKQCNNSANKEKQNYKICINSLNFQKHRRH